MDRLIPENKLIANILYKQLCMEELSEEELRLLAEWQDASEANIVVAKMLNDDDELIRSIQEFHSYDKDLILKELHQRRHATRPTSKRPISIKVWVRYAAASVLILGGIIYLQKTYRKDMRAPTNHTQESQANIAPGREKAILTLADGSKINLDSAFDGKLIQQGSAQVVKLGKGRIAYNEMKSSSQKSIMWNTMSTPAGGQYQLLLQDGTKVWLNAGSSITYPAAFTSDKREVKINGEVYLEVARNVEKPFIVDVNGGSTVEVLGTGFNINSYTDEPYIKTTIVEGSIRVIDENQSAVLKAGQQAIIGHAEATNQGKAITVLNNADLDQAIAWKNGLFSFNNADLRSVMRQVERWYDIKVKYEGRVPDVVLDGEMFRNENLSAILNFLKKMGVNYRQEGRIVVITGA